MDFTSDWNGHKLEEIENAIKSKISDIEGTQHEITSITVEGNTYRGFREEDNEIKVQFRVYHSIGGKFDGQISYALFVDGTQVYTGTATVTENQVLESPDLKQQILSSGKDRNVEVKIVVNEKSRSVYYSKYHAVIELGSNKYTQNSSIFFKYDVSEGVSANLNIVVDDETSPRIIALNSKDVQYEWVHGIEAPGIHTVKAYITLNGGLVTSNAVYVGIVVGNDTGSYVIYEIGDTPKVGTAYDLKFKSYLDGLHEEDAYVVELYRGDTLVSKRKVTNRTLNMTFSIDIYEEQNIYRIVIPEQTSEYGVRVSDVTSVDVVFDAARDEITWTIPEDYEAAWDATDGSYAMLRDKKWYDKTGRYYLELPFDNLFGSYGFGNEYRSAQSLGASDDGNYLTLGYNYRLSGNFFPFKSDDMQYGIQGTGATFSMTFKKRQSPNGSFKIIDAGENLNLSIIQNQLRLVVQGKQIFMPSHQTENLSGHNYNLIPNGEKVNVTLTIQRMENVSSEAQFISVYINGELSARQLIKEEDKPLVLNRSEKFLDEFSDNYLDIYNIYYYRKWMNDMECLRLANLLNKKSDSAVRKYKDNNFFDSQGNITLKNGIAYGKYKASQLSPGKELEFAVVACTDWRTDEDLSDSKHNTTDYDQTENYQYFYLYRFKSDAHGSGTVDGEKTFMVRGRYGTLRIRRQGTTTANEPTANIRVDAKGECDFFRWDSVNEKFYQAEIVKDGVSVKETVKKGDAIWKIRNAPSFTVLTLKHNPNESTQSRNLPTSRWYESCARVLASDSTVGRKYRDVLTPPQRNHIETTYEGQEDMYSMQNVQSIPIRQAIDGIPGIGFKIERSRINGGGVDRYVENPENNENTFTGQYDLITDKKNAAVFGFTDPALYNEEVSEEYSIEFRNNYSSMLNFWNTLSDYTEMINGDPYPTTQQGKNTEKNASLEYRFPEECMKDGEKVDLATDVGSIGLGSDDPLPKLFQFVVGLHTVSDDVALNASDYAAFVGDSNLTSEEKTGILNSLGFDVTELSDMEDFLGSAQDGFYTLSNLEEGAYSEAVADRNRRLKFRCELYHYVVVSQICLNALLLEWGLLIDQDTKNQFFTHFKGDKNVKDEPVLRLLAYDMDTSWGADNGSYISHNAWELYEDHTYDGVVRVSDSVHRDKPNAFWPLVYGCFGHEINEMAIALQKSNGPLTYGYIHKMFFEDHIDIYNELIYNSNAVFSYVEAPTSNRDSLLKKIHGSDRLTTDTLIKERCTFLQGKYFDVSASPDYKNNFLEFTLYSQQDLGISNGQMDLVTMARTYLPYSIQKLRHYKKVGSDYVYNEAICPPNQSGTPQPQSLLDIIGEGKKGDVKFPNGVCIFSTQTRAQNLKARGWFRYAYLSGNVENHVDSGFLDYLDKAQESGVDYYPKRRFLYMESDLRTTDIAAMTGFILKTPDNVGTQTLDTHQDIRFRVYGNFWPIYSSKLFEVQYMANRGLVHPIQEDRGNGWEDVTADGEGSPIEDYLVVGSEAYGLATLGIKRINGLPTGEMGAFGPSNVIGVTSATWYKLVPQSVPENVYLQSFQYDRYIRTDTMFRNTLRLRVLPPTDTSKRTTLDLRKPLFNVQEVNGGFSYIDKIYCYAQAQSKLNPEDITANDFDLLDVGSLPADINTLDFRFNTGEGVKLNNTSGNLHYGYPSSIWALVPLIYIARNGVGLTGVTNFTWINGTAEEPVLTHSYLNYKRSNFGEFYRGKYLWMEDKGAGNSPRYVLHVAETQTDSNYRLFSWEDDEMIRSLYRGGYFYVCRSKEITVDSFDALISLAANKSNMANLKVQGYIKINNGIALTAEQKQQLTAYYPDLHVTDEEGNRLTGDEESYGNLYF